MKTENYNNEYSLGFNRLTNLKMSIRRKLSLYIMVVEKELDLAKLHIREKAIMEGMNYSDYLSFKKSGIIVS